MSGNICAVVKGVNELIIKVQLLKSRWESYVSIAPVTGKGVAINFTGSYTNRNTTSTFTPTDLRM